MMIVRNCNRSRRTLIWFLQELVACVLRLTLLPFLFREFVARKKVVLVNYHNPSPEIFRKHMAWFSQHYSIISMDKLQQCIGQKDFTALPCKPMVITLDDGWSGNRHLFPILEELRIPVVIYVVSGLVDTHESFWWEMSHSTPVMGLLRKVSDCERRQLMQRNAKQGLPRRSGVRSVLSSSELKYFVRIGGTVGSHTASHPILTKCDGETLKHEIFGAKADLEDKIEANVEFFAYPNGNWNEQVQKEVQQARYLNARTIHFGWVTVDSDPYALPCIGIGDKAGVSKAVCQASGLWQLLFRQQERKTERWRP